MAAWYFSKRSRPSKLTGMKVKMLVTQLCPTLCDPMDSSPPGSSVHGILQARILEWLAIPFSRGSSQLRDPTLKVDSLLLSHQGSPSNNLPIFKKVNIIFKILQIPTHSENVYWNMEHTLK